MSGLELGESSERLGRVLSRSGSSRCLALCSSSRTISSFSDTFHQRASGPTFSATPPADSSHDLIRASISSTLPMKTFSLFHWRRPPLFPVRSRCRNSWRHNHGSPPTLPASASAPEHDDVLKASPHLCTSSSPRAASRHCAGRRDGNSRKATRAQRPQRQRNCLK